MGGRRSVLIVDDQPVNVRVLAESLGEQYRILFARTGARALEIAASGDIDLILLDIVLPDVDGFEVCRRLKRETVTRDVPVIFVTALEEVIDETTGFRVGGVDYITKPINPISRAGSRSDASRTQGRARPARESSVHRRAHWYCEQALP